MNAGAPKVFICYRREETAAHAGRLYDALVAQFGEGNVFMDIELEPGIDFVDRITEVVGSCHVLLVIVGRSWVTLSDGADHARIHDREDYVRLEVETALRRSDVRVIPLLVGGARMPHSDELPEAVRALTRRNAFELSDTRWRYDVGRLMDALASLLSDTQPPLPEADERAEGPQRPAGRGETAATAVAEPTDASATKRLDRGEATAPPSGPPPGDAPPSRWKSVFSRAAGRLRDRFRSGARARPRTLPAGLPSEEPPRSAYALLDGPDWVVCGERFDVVVGLAPQAVAGVVGEEMTVPDSVVGAYTLSVQVVADGFALAHGGDWRVEMPVSAREPYPAVALRLVAEPQQAPVRARTLQAVYSIGGQTLGLAIRPIAVLRDRQQRAAEAATHTDPGFDVAIPEDWIPPDLTVHILGGKEENAGRLLWTFETPHRGVQVPPEEVVAEIGDEPQTFSARLMKNMPAYEGQPDLHDYIVGVGKSVADKVPDVFWSLLAEVAQQHPNETPSVLLLSAEPYVPWELAVMEKPLDPQSPPFLSAQARVGRWVLGHRRPKLPPPMSATANSIAVVFGRYDRPNWQRLMEAEAEAADLQSSYHALPVNADSETVLRCIKGHPPADVLHFAVHGNYDPSGELDGLVLVDGRTLDPMVVKGNTFQSPVFVFLNACQVGTGDRVLGDYAGMAAAFLYAGAAGVVAPLWSIDDAQARRLALDFYEAVFSGTAPADLLRRERSNFTDDPRPTSSTYIAYQFFGHPDLRLARN
jgi:hypothetical protein